MGRRLPLVFVVLAVVLAGCPSGGLSGSFDSTDRTTGSATPEPTAARPVPTPSDGTFTPAERVSVTVVRVVDGDTIDVRFPDGREDTVRLVGVDTPETHVENDPDEYEGVPATTAGGTCLREAGHDATAYTRHHLSGASVTIAFDPQTDRRGGYDRLLAYVYADGRNLNYALVATGHARLYDTDFALRDAFAAAEERARTAGRGLWTCRNVTRSDAVSARVARVHRTSR